MANAWYSKGLYHFSVADINWLTANIKVVACSSGYTPNLASDEFLSAILAGNRVAVSGNLSGKTSTGAGIMDSSDVTFTAVSGSPINRFVVYKDTGDESTSLLLWQYDTGTNIPVTPNGGDIVLQWDNGANKMAAL